MNIIDLLLLISFLANFIIGLLVFLKNRRRSLNFIIFGSLTFSVAFWCLSLFIFRNLSDIYYIGFWGKIVHIFGAYLAPSFLIFSIDFNNDKRNKYIYYFLLSLFIILVSIIFFSNSIIGNGYIENGINSVEYKEFYYFFILYLSSHFSIGFYYLIKKYLKTNNYLIKEQIKYILLGTIISSFGGIIFDTLYPLFFDFSLNWIGPVITIIMVLSIGYAIIKYRFLDIRLIISKSIIYFILVSFITLIFIFFTFTFGEFFARLGISRIFITFILSFIIIITIDPLKHFLAKITDKIFYKGKIDYQEVLRKLSEIIAIEIDLNKLLINLSKTLSKLIKCENVDFLYLQDSAGIYRGILDKNILITKNDNIFNYINDKREIIVTEELERLSFEANNTYDLVGIVDRLKKMQVGLIAPIIAEDKITAFLIITKKLSGDIFSGQDVDLISVLTPQIANALEKAKLYGEIQTFNIKLQDKVDQATRELKQVNIDLASRNKYLVALQKISSTITRTLDLSAVIEFIASSVRNELGFVGGVVNFIDEDNKNIKIGGMSSDQEVRNAVSILKKDPRDYKISLDEKNNAAIKSIVTGEIQKSDKVYNFFGPAINELDANKIQELLGIKSGVSVPIYSEDKIIGSIDFFLAKETNEIKKSDLDVMKALADQTGLVIRNLNLYRELSNKNMELKDANIHLKKLDQAKSEFLSIASHQLRTPLTGIKGYLSMIIEGDYGKVPDKLLRIVKEVFEAGDRMSRLVNVFLNVSRIESGRLKLDFSEIDILNIIEKSIKDLESSAKKKKIDLSFEDIRSDDKKNKKIIADPDKLKDAILNLIDNAIKYTEKGFVKVELSNDENNIIVKIKDTGIGLSKSEIDRLFSKFSRGDDSAKINTDGSGLGLYIARKIVEAHNGKIWVESEGKGKGSIFQFTLSFDKTNII